MCRVLKCYLHLLWRYCRYKKPKILIFLPLILTAVYFEWFCYILLPYQWPNLNCGLVEKYHKILFVADPQILGENTEYMVSRGDCDRFLKLTFSKAVSYVKPDLVIFLGDLMDEGSMATPDQYDRYYQRFKDIFQLDNWADNQTIFLPGDNDIGGEDEEVTEFKIRRFSKHFPSKSDIIYFKNMKFYLINAMLQTYPTENSKNNDTLKIILSHIPLLGIHSTIGEEAISELKPLLVFSAHEHKSAHMVTGRHNSQREIVELLDHDSSAWRFGLSSSGARVNEIVIPTASYRMGVNNYGYSVSFLSTDGSVLCYFILWSPRRLFYLLFYIILIIITFLAYICYYIRYYRSMKLTSYKTEV